ncbi:MAG: hypothetical protein E7256_07310 [Lachnospiraceae bacterium]|nr:hypothetical protein [Lachnospiraceae bacterium]
MKQVLTRNIGMKILSLFLATLLWVVIMNIDDPYITAKFENIPVQIMNETALGEVGKMYEVESGETVTIKVRGKRSIVDNLKASDFEATANFREMSPVYAVPINVTLKSSKYSEDDLEIEKMTQMMTLSLEDADEQIFRINVVTTGDAAEGYYVAETITNPNLIKITGSKKQIAKIKEVIVEVNVQDVKDSFVTTGTPVAYGENGYQVDSVKLTFETTQVDVDVKVLPTKEISLLITQEGEPYDGYYCSTPDYMPKTIIIAGTKEDLSKIYYLKIPVDVTLQKETISTQINIEEYLSEEYILVGNENNVAVTIKIEELDTKYISVKTRDITVKNLPEEYEVVYNSGEQVNVSVMGIKEVLDSITAYKLKPYIDMEDLNEYEPGTYFITLKTDSTEDITVNSTISITIRKKAEAE